MSTVTRKLIAKATIPLPYHPIVKVPWTMHHQLSEREHAPLRSRNLDDHLTPAWTVSEIERGLVSVSYTHLTLPTILLV